MSHADAVSQEFQDRNDGGPLLLDRDFLERATIGFTSLVLLSTLVLNQTHIETNDAIKLAGKLELILRLTATGLAGLLGLYGFLFVPKVRSVFFSFPGAWVFGILVFLLMGTALAEYPVYSAPYFIIAVAVTLFSPFAFHVLGSKRFFDIVLLAMVVTLAGSWFLYLFLPEYGVKAEFISLTESIPRMAGTSHPNTLSGQTVLMMVIVSYLGFEGKRSWLFCLPLLAICTLTLYLTGTRVAAVAAVAAVLIVYRSFWFRVDVLPFTAAIAVAALLGALVLFSSEESNLISSSLVSSTRSGDIEEISSFTGRAVIWDYVIDMIHQRPLQGYGPGTAKIYLSEKQFLLHAHNEVLHLAFAGGIFAGACTAMILLHQLFVSIVGRNRLAALLSFVIILVSMTEVPFYDYFPGNSTILFLTAVFWADLDDGSL